MTKVTPLTNAQNIALMSKDIGYIKAKVDEVDRKLEGTYITRYEFDPIKRVVYGLVGLILTAVVGGLIGLIIIK